MARKNLLADLIEGGHSSLAGEAAAAAPEQRVPTLGSRGAVGAMSRSLEQLSAERDAAKVLSERLVSGQDVVEIDADLVDDSIIPDRMKGSDANFASFKESIRTRGQLVPALLRPHPTQPGRYQTAYGHRRVQALRELGRPVRAVVQDLSDDELVVAQGKENGEREDLSFIERARYATLLEDRNFKRDTIMAALSVDKTELSRLISIYRAIPAELSDAIGPAPKVGRRRWLEFVEHLGDRKPAKTLEALLGNPKFLAGSSDDRFRMALSILTAREGKTAKATVWTANDGKRIAKIDRSPSRFILSVDEKAAPSFGDFVLDRLPDLYEAFRKSKEGA
ncbi:MULTISPECIES: plasmid partitioning protein RepB [Hansschlegelia]|uniref:Plasmid partitioning protein RepB n=1 Tax=Hansschlegelia zhihuaiae TaxID=405005 RepID=A0A4Q0MEW3_9HYPH|nr:plasmid partitioning protein RepB [Hansschlegelia zhihuaiae]RXF71416.1 plasmid partitioning protein RepB [Hansschlegelia zhihuaiae]